MQTPVAYNLDFAPKLFANALGPQAEARLTSRLTLTATLQAPRGATPACWGLRVNTCMVDPPFERHMLFQHWSFGLTLPGKAKVARGRTYEQERLFLEGALPHMAESVAALLEAGDRDGALRAISHAWDAREGNQS